jgi:transposase InsO family protein
MHSYWGNIFFFCKPFLNDIAIFSFNNFIIKQEVIFFNLTSGLIFGEYYNGTKLKTREQMRLDVFEYIESWYNHKRRFSALGNLTIDEFWEQYNIKKQSIKNVA